MNFNNAIKKKVQLSKKNSYGLENLEGYKLREHTQPFFKKTISLLKYFLKRKYNRYLILYVYKKDFNRLFKLLDERSKNLLVELMAYKIMGYKKIKLSINNESYSIKFQKIKDLEKKGANIPNLGFKGLRFFNLDKLGYEIKILYTFEGVMMDFVLEQYAYKCNGQKVVEAEEGDVVLDLGGCWGDTALYFAEKVGEKGKVYSFEFIPRNIEVHEYNREINPKLSKQITLIPQPVYNKSNLNIYYKDKAQGSKVQTKFFRGSTGISETITIDDFVSKKELTKLDFIKMDIEGAELAALEGARKTILKFKPKLAIAIYHSIKDYAKIGLWINDLNIGYRLRMGHYTIFDEETICFAYIE